MMYHAPTKQFVITASALEGVVIHLRYAIRGVRELGGFPLEPHKRPGPMTRACHLEKSLLDLAAELGIDMGGKWPGKIDVRDAP